MTRRRVDQIYGWLMVLVLLAGAGMAAATLAAPDARRQLAGAVSPGALLSGKTAATVDAVLAHDLPGGAVLRAAGGILRWRLFGAGGPAVTVGCRGWLYLTEELRPWPGGEAAMRDRAAALQRIAADLTRQGIALHVVLIPDKAAVATEGACGLPRSAQAQARHQVFLDLLQGLPVTDLLPVFAGVRTPLFYRTDTHWNADGAALAAASVASTIDAPIDPSHRFQTRYGPEAERPGDLLRLMGLDQVPDLPLPLRPLPDRQRPAITAEVDPRSGLLDVVAAPEVVLLGTSFALNSNFLGALEQALSAPVAQFARDGGGFWRAAQGYFRSRTFSDTPPKLVIWEIPERVVNQPVGADEADFLRNWRGP